MSALLYTQLQSFEDSGCVADGIPTLQCFEVVFNNVLILSAAFVVLILFIMFVIGSFQYLTSRGDPEKTGSARKTIMYAVIGLILFMSSYLILNIIQVLFLGDPEDGAPSLLEFRLPQFEPGEFDGDGTQNPDTTPPPTRPDPFPSVTIVPRTTVPPILTPPATPIPTRIPGKGVNTP